MLVNLLTQEDVTKVIGDADLLASFSNGITGINKKKLQEMLSSSESLSDTVNLLVNSTALVKKGFGIESGQNIVFANGRVNIFLTLPSSCWWVLCC